MAEAYETMKATELRALLKSKHGTEPAKGMLKSAMINLLVELDSKAASGSAAPAAVEETAIPAEPASVAKKTEKAPTKKATASAKTTVTADVTSASSPAPAKASAAAKPKETAKVSTSVAKEAKVTATATKPAPKADSSAPKAEATPVAAPSSSASGETYNPLSAEALSRRAKRFGTSEESEKLAARAERFGQTYKDDNPLLRRAEQAKKKEEQQAKKAADLAAFNQRAQRFGLPVKVDREAENAKKRARAERFKTDLSNKKPKLHETQ